MLQPKRTKFRKQFKGRNPGLAQRGSNVSFRVFPDVPISKTPREVRMGSGKGNVEYYVARVQPGKVLFEMEGVDEVTAREAFRLAGSKLSVSTTFVKRQVR